MSLRMFREKIRVSGAMQLGTELNTARKSQVWTFLMRPRCLGPDAAHVFAGNSGFQQNSAVKNCRKLMECNFMKTVGSEKVDIEEGRARNLTVMKFLNPQYREFWE